MARREARTFDFAFRSHQSGETVDLNFTKDAVKRKLKQLKKASHHLPTPPSHPPILPQIQSPNSSPPISHPQTHPPRPALSRSLDAAQPPNSIPPERVFSILNDTFDDDTFEAEFAAEQKDIRVESSRSTVVISRRGETPRLPVS